jgi:hypothetical protein
MRWPARGVQWAGHAYACVCICEQMFHVRSRRQVCSQRCIASLSKQSLVGTMASTGGAAAAGGRTKSRPNKHHMRHRAPPCFTPVQRFWVSINIGLASFDQSMMVSCHLQFHRLPPPCHVLDSGYGDEPCVRTACTQSSRLHTRGCCRKSHPCA